MRFTKITIIRANVPKARSVNEELQWLGASLGLFNLRDKDKSCFRIFVTLIKSLKAGRPLSSDDVADQLNLTRGTVIHHLNKLMESGLVVQEKNHYVLSVETLEELVDVVQKNINRALDGLKSVAKDLDERLEL